MEKRNVRKEIFKRIIEYKKIKKEKRKVNIMRKLTIAELREKELKTLVAFKTVNPTEADYQEARKNMNSFYRLCGLCETNLYLANDEKRCNSRYTQESEERENKWFDRLNKIFTDTYGLNLMYCGYCPSIGTVNKNGGFSEKVNRYFYN